MPELPEVETVRTGLAAHLPGRVVCATAVQRTDLRWPIPAARVHALAGRRCLAVGRRAKVLLLMFDGPGAPVALIHLGMSGRLLVDEIHRGPAGPQELIPWRRHEHWRFDFGDRLLRAVDPRRFGSLDVVDAAGLSAHLLLRNLGPEPLPDGTPDGDRFDASHLHGSTRRKRCSIRQFLMDAGNVAGIGNIYASEACHHAGIRPRRAAGSLSWAECTRLVLAVQAVLRAAIAAGGTTLKDHVGVDEGAGYFQQELAVYGRGGQPCGRCGAIIRRVVEGSRAAYYCPGCQR